MFGKYSVYIYVNFFLFLTTVVAYIPLQFLQVSFLKPNLLLVSVFYFSIFPQTRPNLMYLILLGLFDDLLSDSLVGTTSLIYVLTSLFASSNQKALSQQRFSIVWASLILVVVVMNLLKGFMISVYYQIGLFGIETVIVVALTCLIYPSLHMLYSFWVNRIKANNA